jgi:hypothetical protein
LVPIAFADGAWMGDNAFSVSDADVPPITISRSGLTNDDGTAEIRIYKDSAGTQPVSLNEPIDMPSSRVLVLWVTGNFEASEEFTYQVNVQGSSQDPHKIKVRLPKLDFVNEGTTTRIPSAQAEGSDPTKTGSRVNKGVYMGEGLERYIAAFDPADGSLCTDCNFKINVNAWVTDENDNRITGGLTDNSVLRADVTELKNGVGELTFRGVAEVNGPGFNPAYAALSIRGPSTLESTKAFWNGMVFTKPPVPIPVAVEIFDRDGDGKGDELRIAYDRIFVKTSNDSLPPNKIEVMWDPSKKDTLRFGRGTFTNGKWELSNDVSNDQNWTYWTSDNSDDNFEFAIEGRDSIIVISGKLSDGVYASFSDGIKTSKGIGNVVIRNWATFMDKGGIRTTTGFESEISDKIPAIVVSAIFTEGNFASDGSRNDQVQLTLSEPVKKVNGVEDRRTGDLPTLAAPFQYKLVHNVSKDNWDTYANERDLPALSGGRSNMRWRPAMSVVEPDGTRDSIVTITYKYFGGDNETNTPLRGDSVKFVSGTNAALTDLEGNLPNPREWGRRLVGEISITTEKVPIGEVDPECSQNDEDVNSCRNKIIEKIKERNPDFTERQKQKIDDLFKDEVTDYLPVPEGWDAKKVSEQYPGTVGIVLRPDVVSKGVAPEHISFYSSAFYHTNLGNYVVETAPLRELKCTDAIFDGDCTRGNGMGIYLAWNMRDAKNRWAGAGAYVEVYDFYWKIDSDEKDKNGTFDKVAKKIEMLGVKRAKK